jgi:GTPase SAR1 family protein
VNSDNLKRREKLIGDYLKLLNIKVENREVILQKENITFHFHLFQRSIETYLSECSQCTLDCNKSLELYLEAPPALDLDVTELESEDLVLLAQIKKIAEDLLPLSIEDIQERIKRRLHVLNFGLIGFDQVGKTTLFELLPGKPKKVGELLNTYTKEITSFPPLKVKVYDYGNPLMENLASNSPAPLLLEKLRRFYMFIIVSDSSAQDIMAIKQFLIPKLKKMSPYAAFIVLANKQDLPNRLSTSLIETILGERTYPISAIKLESKDFFNNLINEIILLRQDQIREFKCPFL